jgi:hypothetical protein
MPVKPLAIERLYKRCDPAHLSFNATDELEVLKDVIGQARALEATRWRAR